MNPRRQDIVNNTEEIYRACVSIVKHEAVIAMPQRIQHEVTSSQFMSQITTVVGLFKEILEDEKYEEQMRQIEVERHQQEYHEELMRDVGIATNPFTETNTGDHNLL